VISRKIPFPFPFSHIWIKKKRNKKKGDIKKTGCVVRVMCYYATTTSLQFISEKWPPSLSERRNSNKIKIGSFKAKQKNTSNLDKVWSLNASYQLQRRCPLCIRIDQFSHRYECINTWVMFFFFFLVTIFI
jgi:hypothetical protein